MSSNTKNRPDAKKSEEKNNNKLVVFLIIALIAIVIAFVVVVVLLLGRKSEDGNTSGREVVGSARLVVDEESAANVMEEMHEAVEEGMFECQMSMTWTFDNGSSESKDAYVANSVNNSHPIYFDVFLEGSDESLYSSPVLPVGTDISGIKLSKDLEAGEYRATVMYTLLSDVESQEEMSKAGFVIKIKVLN